MILKMLRLKPPPPTHSDGSDEELQTSPLSSEEHDVGKLQMSENSSSVGKEEQIIENIAYEEEDPEELCPEGFHPGPVDDTCNGRSCRFSVVHLQYSSTCTALCSFIL